MRLPPRQAHLWVLDPAQLEAPQARAALERILSPAELRRRSQFRFPGLQQTFLVSRALVRSALSCFAAVRPEDWTFGANAYGKPHVLCAGQVPPFHFSLSHTEGLVALLVAREPLLGVDVECLDRRLSDVEQLGAWFSAAERADLMASPPAARPERFLVYWTLKEAYIKARGMGLSLPLDRFSFQLKPDGPARISFDPSSEDRPEEWQFLQLRPTDRHLLAIAIRRTVGGDSAVEVHRELPLRISP
jgi:4'-phosphopantetheinyl transferase